MNPEGSLPKHKSMVSVGVVLPLTLIVLTAIALVILNHARLA
jgi:hypothetical protein